MIPLSIPHLDGNEWKYVKECLDTGWISSAGSYVTKFEEAVAEYDYPVMMGFPAGHDHLNLPLIFGKRVSMKVEAGACQLIF